MRKLKMPKQQLNNFEDVFHIFEASQNAKGVSETTLNNYKYNLKNQILSHSLFQIKDTKNRNHIIQRTDYVPPRWAWW